MPLKVGIPRAMSYYYFFPYYLGFLRGLGVDVTLSPPTSGKIMDLMLCCPTDEPCISVKLAFAHSRYLLDKGVDRLFVPVLSSIDDGNWCCPKHIGLPYMLAGGLDLPRDMLIAPRFDRRGSPDGGRSTFYTAARRLGIDDDSQIKRALEEAARLQSEYRRLTSGGLTGPEAMVELGAGPLPSPRRFDRYARYRADEPIGVVAHAYTVHDRLCHDLIARLREHGPVLTPEMTDFEAAKKAVSQLWQGDRLWGFEVQMLGSMLHWLETNRVTRLVLVSPFECGPEAIIEPYVEQAAERFGVPLLILTVDEQTGEAGIATRLEAFFDSARPVAGTPDAAISGDRPEKIRVATPTMGTLDIGLRTLLGELDVDAVPTPALTSRTVERGLELAPEFICYPMVTTIGQMRDALDQGATTLLMVGGKGRCRLGWYAQVQEQLLRRAGYEFEMIIVDSPFPLRRNFGQFAAAIRRLVPIFRWPKIIGAARFGFSKILALDRGDELARKYRAVEAERGTTDQLLSRYYTDLEQAGDIGAVEKLVQDLAQNLAELKVADDEPVRVRIVGEVYVVVEKFANMDIDRVLGGLPGVRVEVDREVSTSRWIRQHLLHDRDLMRRHHAIEQAACRYLPEPVGGHGLESVGLTALAGEEGVDGVVHLLPFTCMPEIVASSIMVKLGSDQDIPILTLVVSDQTGQAGIQTRLEAFVDVLVDRKHQSVAEVDCVGSVPGH